jgi:putative ABC transport system permease protein
MFSELFQLAISNLGRARARLAMTAGGVVVGTTAVILLIAMTLGLQAAAEAGIGNDASLTQIDVYQAWNETGAPTPQLNDEAVAALWRIPGVRVVVPYMRLQAGELHAEDYAGYSDIIGIDPRLLPYMGWQAEQGEPRLGEGLVVIGAAVSQNFYDPENTEEYSPVTVDLMTTPLELRMYNYTTGGQRDIDLFPSAILSATGGYNDYVIYMAIDDVKEWNEWITGQPFDPETFVYDQITVFATNRETAGEVSEAIRKMGYGAGGMGDYLEQLNNFFVTMRLMLGAVGGVALLVAAFGVANTMMMAIMERTKEIGIMKAIGANNETILTLFLLEAGLVGFVGGLAGVLLSKVLQNLINTGIQNMPQGEGGINFLPIDPSQIGGNLIIIPQELIIFALLLATGVGIVAGLYPAWRAAKMPPVLALKQD